MIGRDSPWQPLQNQIFMDRQKHMALRFLVLLWIWFLILSEKYEFR